MPTPRRLSPAVCVLLAAALAPASARSQPPQRLLYTPIAPCRVANTSAPIAANTSMSFQVLGSGTDYTAQGGSGSGCGIPDLGGVQAVFFNFVAKNPSGAGNLRAYAGDGTLPSASTLNFQLLSPNLNIANGVAIPVRTTGSPGPGEDLKVYSAVSSTGVVIDAVGYFSLARRRKYYLTTATQNGAGADAICAAGYHFASVWEILDTTQLEYNTALGYTALDSGQGPPTDVDGWVRTGYTSDDSTSIGRANCLLWDTASSGSRGTTVTLSQFWDLAAQRVSPWSPITGTCDVPHRSWCIED